VKSLWEQVWESQDRKCSKCGNEVRLEDTAKNSHSFEIVCRTCFEASSIDMIIFDEFEG